MSLLLTLILLQPPADAAPAAAPQPDAAAAVAEALAAPPADGLLVYEVVPGSQSAEQGVAVGDVLTVYNGQRVPTIADLQRAAREAFGAKQQDILVLLRRGDREIELHFEPSPLGLRLVPVAVGAGRDLWKPATPFERDIAGVSAAISQGIRHEIALRDDLPVGWARMLVQFDSQTLVHRRQSRIGLQDPERLDTTLRVAVDDAMTPQSVLVIDDGRPVLTLERDGERLAGRRMGFTVDGPCPSGTVAAELAPLVATTMPQQPGACLRHPFLAPGGVSAAPYADLCCVGQEELPTLDGRTMPTFRYEHRVFGVPNATYWVTADRRVVQRSEGGLVWRTTTAAVTEKVFPGHAEEFPAIDQHVQLAQPLAN